MIVYKIIFRPILICRSESWVLKDAFRSKLESIDMKYLKTGSKGSKGKKRQNKERCYI